MSDFILPLRTLLLVGLALVSTKGGCAASADQVAPHEQEYKQVLFHYFQGDYEATLMAIALAEKRLKDRPLRPEMFLLKGAASLSLGLHQEAQAIFNRLLAGQVDEKTQAKAWFFLAKSAYENDQKALAALAAANLSQSVLPDHLNTSQQYELGYLQGMLALHQGNTTDIERLLKALPEGQIQRAYLGYNLAMLEARNRAYDNALRSLSSAQSALAVEPDTSWFNLFGSPEKDDMLPEKQALTDKVLLAKGRLLLIQQKLPEAMATFENLGVDAIDRDEALYHYANTRYQYGDQLQALALWQYLKNSPSDTMRYPAAFALATGLEEAGDAQQALENYQFIIDAVEGALIRLSELSLQIKKPGELEAFLSYQSTDEYDWQRVLLQTFVSSEHASDLRTFEALKEQHRELVQLSTRIDNMKVLMDERKEQRDIRARAIESGSYRHTLQLLEERYQQLSEALKAGESDASVFADTHQRDWLSRLEKAYTRANRLANNTNLNPEYFERLNRIKGILSWQLENTQVERSWLVESQLKETREQIDRAKAQVARIKTLSDNSDDLGLQAQRVADLALRIERHTQQSTGRIVDMEKVLIDSLQDMLASHGEQLQQYLYHSKLASIRLRDMSQSQDSSDDYNARNGLTPGGAE